MLSAGFVFVASMAVLLAAYGFQHLAGMEPCQLCFWQRYPYFVIIPLALLAVFLTGARRALLFLCGLGFLTGLGIALYHVGVEFLWWPGPDACSPVATSIEELLARERVVRCDEPATHDLLPFGQSMAFYNLVFSGVMAIYCLYAAVKGSR